MTTFGRVYLVGAGPGDPDLLTVKAHRLLRQAEVVVYDRLVSPIVLDLIPPSAERIFVGKAARHHSMRQEEINALLVRLARSGRNVVRLKGGDPFIFGRGSEEALTLAEAGISFEVVPGVTAASGCTAAAGIPLTHRGLATSVRLVTGHCRDDIDLDLDWAGLADPQTTLVFYMAAGNADIVRDRLIAAGRAPATPTAIISNGTTEAQAVRITTLGNLPECLAQERLPPPCLVVIGEVVDLSRWLAPAKPDARQREFHQREARQLEAVGA